MFSKTAEYAIRATIYIAKQSEAGKRIGIDEISEAIDSPRSFTAKILQLLTKDEIIVSSVRGPNGGFYISEKSKKLTVRTVLQVIGEDEIFTKCILGLDECTEIHPCPMHHRYKLIKEDLVKLFSSKTISDLAREVDNSRIFINNRKAKSRA